MNGDVSLIKTRKRKGAGTKCQQQYCTALLIEANSRKKCITKNLSI